MSDSVEIDLSLEVSKNVLARIAKAVIGFGGSIVFARLIGPADFGGFFLLMAIFAIIKTPFEAWMSSTKKRFAEAEVDRSGLFGLTLLIIASTVLVVAAGLGFGGQLLVNETGIEGAPLMFAALLISVLFFSSIQQLVAATGKVALAEWIDTIRSMGTLVFRLALILGGLGALGMGYGLVASTVLATFASYQFFRVRPTIPNRTTIRRVYEHARYNIVAAIGGSIYGRIDKLLLGGLLTATQVGYYQVALQLSIPGTFVGGAIGGTLLPKVSNLSSQGEDVSEHVTNSLSFASMISIPVFFGSLTMPQALIETVFGGQYRVAGTFLVGLTLYRAIQSQTSIINTVLSGIDMPRAIAKINFLTLFINVILGPLLLFSFGGIGVVMATVVSESVRYAGSALILKRRRPGVSLFPSLLRRQILSGAVMSGVVWWLRGQVVIRSWVEIVIIIGVGGIVYFAFLTLVSPQLRGTASDVFQKVQS